MFHSHSSKQHAAWQPEYGISHTTCGNNKTNNTGPTLWKVNVIITMYIKTSNMAHNHYHVGSFINVWSISGEGHLQVFVQGPEDPYSRTMIGKLSLVDISLPSRKGTRDQEQSLQPQDRGFSRRERISPWRKRVEVYPWPKNSGCSQVEGKIG